MTEILSVASEIFPLVKTGGLADVAGALPAALKPHGFAMRCLVPGYRSILQHLGRPQIVWQEKDFFGGPASMRISRAAGLDLIVLDAPHLYGRPGTPYQSPDGGDWPDNPLRFAALAYAAYLVGTGALANYRPQILHLHDWQTALAPAYLHYAGAHHPKTILTIHNLAFQGLAPLSMLAALRLPPAANSIGAAEFHGQIGMLKAGISFANRITTVSPTYADEIRTPEHGMGLDGALRYRAEAVSGIVNGIDTNIWNPETDAALPVAYGVQNRQGKTQAKRALQSQFGLEARPDAPLFGVISRLSHQKGLDLLLDVLDAVLDHGAQLAVLGAGDADLQSAFLRAAERHPSQIGVQIGYDEKRAHLIQGGADAILVPSRFEPCGLTQLCALRYGSIPIVSRVGGLADTVIDANVAALQARAATGIQFTPVTAYALRNGLGRAIALFKNTRLWTELVTNAMRAEVGWAGPASAYATLYADLLNA